MEKEHLIKKIKGYFKSQPDVCAVYLFGSYAREKATGISDVDLGVLFYEDFSLMERFERRLQMINDLEGLLEKKVDVVDLESADSYFLHQVMLHKELLLERDQSRRVAFEVKRRREYFDRQRFYQLHHQQSIERLRKDRS